MSATQEEVDRLIEQFDPESNFRRLAGLSAGIVLVLAAGSPGDGPEVKRAEGQGTRFVSGSRDIGNHWANRFGTSRPH